RDDQVDETVERSAPVGRVAIPSKNVKNVKPPPGPQRKGKGIAPDPKAALMQKSREQRTKLAPQQTVAPPSKDAIGTAAGSYTQPSAPAKAGAQDTSQVQTRKK